MAAFWYWKYRNWNCRFHVVFLMLFNKRLRIVWNTKRQYGMLNMVSSYTENWRMNSKIPEHQLDLYIWACTRRQKCIISQITILKRLVFNLDTATEVVFEVLSEYLLPRSIPQRFLNRWLSKLNITWFWHRSCYDEARSTVCGLRCLQSDDKCYDRNWSTVKNHRLTIEIWNSGFVTKRTLKSSI